MLGPGTEKQTTTFWGTGASIIHRSLHTRRASHDVAEHPHMHATRRIYRAKSLILRLQSWLYGKVIQAWEPDAVALHSSRGFENSSSKLLMRLSVIASDLMGERQHTSADSHPDNHEVRYAVSFSVVPGRHGSCASVWPQQIAPTEAVGPGSRSAATSCCADRSWPFSVQQPQPRICGESQVVGGGG